MSTTVDERIVSMQFDNSHFEKNVQTSMHTLTKLEKSLKLDNASKSLTNLQTAANKIDFSKIENTACRAGFSLQDVWLKTSQVFEYQVARRIVNAAKSIVTAFTIDPVKTGFAEYETQLNAVQTILANTESKGSTLEQVNAALDELNTYADKTIYNFTEMTKNIGTFTAAGVDLETSVSAIKGIANLAAVSGSTSQQASTAMYQLSQALASGTVKLMDWNSVVNAGMGGEVFQNALKETARVHDIAIDDMIESQGSFRETLSEGWLTAEILTETLEHFTMAAEEGSEEWKAYKNALIDDGYTEEQAESILKLANTAEDAATKVKTFTQLMSTLKEAAQSGWAQTWRIVIGDFEEAKELWGSASEYFGSVINSVAEARNTLLESAFGRSLTNMLEPLNGLLSKTTKTIEGVKTAIDDTGVIVDEVILGKFGNGKERIDSLTEAGYNWYRVQNKVNEVLGESHRYSDELIEEQDEKLGRIVEETEATSKLTDEQKEKLKTMFRMTEAEAEANGYTKEQVEALRSLREQAEKLGMPLDEFVDKLDEINGRWMLIEGIKNIGKGLAAIFKSIGDAWREIFEPINADQLFNVLAGFYKFTRYLVISEETADKLTRIFKGLFATVDTILTTLLSPIQFLFKLVGAVFENLGYVTGDVLEFAASIGDLLVVANEFIQTLIPMDTIIEFLAEHISNAIRAISKWIDSLGLLEGVSKWITKVSDALGDWIDTLKESDNIPRDIIRGLVNGIVSGVSIVVSAIKNLGLKIIEGLKNVLGIHSPSLEMYLIGGFIVMGLIYGITEHWDGMKSTLGRWLDSVIEFFRGLDFGGIKDKGAEVLTNFGEGLLKAWNWLKGIFDKIFGWLKTTFTDENGKFKWEEFGSIATLLGTLFVLKGTSSLISTLGNVVKAVTSIFDGVGELFDGIGRSLKGLNFLFISEAILNVVKAVMLLVVALLALTYIASEHNLWPAFGIIAATTGLVAALLVLMALVAKYCSAGAGGFKTAIAITSFSLSLLMMLGVIALIMLIAKNDQSKIWKAYGVLAAMSGLLLGLSLIMSIPTGKRTNPAFMRMALSMLILLGVIAIIAKTPESTIEKGMAVVQKMMVFMALIALATGGISIGNKSNILGGNSWSRSSITNRSSNPFMGVAMTLFSIAAVIALIGSIPDEQLNKGLKVIYTLMGVLLGFAVLLTFLDKLDVKIGKSGALGKGSNKYGALFASLGALLLSMALSILILKGIAPADLWKATGVVAALMGVITIFLGVVLVFSKDGKGFNKAASMLVSLCMTIVLLALTIWAISKLSFKDILPAAAAIAVFLLEVIFICAFASKAEKSMGSLLAIAAMLGILGAALAVLSHQSQGGVWSSVGALAVMLAGVIVVLALIKKIVKDKSGFNKIIPILSVLAGVIAILTSCLAVLANIHPGKVWSSVGALVTMLAAMVGALVVIKILTKSGGKSLNKAIPILSVLVGIIGVLTGVLFALQHINPSWKIVANIGIIAGILLAMYVMLFGISKLKGAINKNTIVTLGVLMGVLGVLVGVLYALQYIDPSWDMVKSVGLIATLMGALVLTLKYISKNSKTITKSSIATLAILTGIIAVLVGVIVALEDVKCSKDLALNIALMVGLLVAICSMLVWISKANKSISKSTIATLVILTGIIAVLTGVIVALEDVKFSMDMLKNVGLIAGLLIIVVGMLLIIGKMKKAISNTAILTLITLAGVLAVLTGVLYVLQIIKPSGTMAGNIGIIAGLLLGMIGLLLLISKAKSAISTKAIFALLILAGVLAVLTGVLYVLQDITPEWKMIGSIALMALLLATVCGALLLLQLFKGSISKSAIATLVVLAGILAVLTGVLFALQYIKPDWGMLANIGMMALLLAAVCGALLLLQLFKGSIQKGTIGILVVLTAIIAVLAGVLYVLNLIENPGRACGMAALLVVFLAAMALVLLVIGKMGSIAKGTMAILIALAAIVVALAAVLYLLQDLNITQAWNVAILLVAFVTVLVALLYAISEMNSPSAGCVSTLVILAGIVTLIAGILLLTQDLDVTHAIGVAGLLITFVGLLVALLFAISKMNDPSVKSIVTLGILTVAVGLIAGILLLTQDLDVGHAIGVAALLITFMGLMVGLLAIINTMKGPSKASIVTLGILTVIVATLAGIILLLKDIDGVRAIAQVGAISIFLGVMIAVAKSCVVLNAIGKYAVIGAAYLAAVIGILGGVVAGIIALLGCGLAALGWGLSEFMEGLGPFIDKVGQIDGNLLKNVTILANAIGILSAAGFLMGLSNLWNKIKEWFGGKDTLATSFERFGKAFVAFSEAIDGKINVSAVQTAANALNAFAKFEDINISKFEDVTDCVESFNALAAEMANVDYSGILNFSKAATSIQAWSKINYAHLKLVMEQAIKLRDFISGLANIDYTGASSFETALGTVADNSITKFTEVFDNASETTVSSVDNMISSTASSVQTEENYNKFHSVATYLVSGFIQGISDNIDAAANKAAAMARAARQAAEAEFDINSPSKVFYQIGAYAGQGLVIALDDYSDKSYDAGANIGNEAKQGLQNAISKISDSIESDIDNQPTIRPVLDLSDVENGADFINSMLSMNPSVGVSANISSINSMMNNRQNGASTNDLLSAIETLGSKMSENSGNTYTINGITYDDGSNVANAIETLVRAAKITRRI